MKTVSPVSFFDLLNNSINNDGEVLLEDIHTLDSILFEDGSISGSINSLRFKNCVFSNCVIFLDFTKRLKVTFDSSSMLEFSARNSVKKRSNISLNFENTLIEKHFVVHVDVQELVLSKCTIGSLYLNIKILHPSRNLVFRKLRITSMISLNIKSDYVDCGIYVSQSLSNLFHNALPGIRQNIYMEE